MKTTDLFVRAFVVREYLETLTLDSHPMASVPTWEYDQDSLIPMADEIIAKFNQDMEGLPESTDINTVIFELRRAVRYCYNKQNEEYESED